MTIDKVILKIVEAKRLALKTKRFKTFSALDKAEKIAGWELSSIMIEKSGVTK